jgi:hypothetical protein
MQNTGIFHFLTPFVPMPKTIHKGPFTEKSFTHQNKKYTYRMYKIAATPLLSLGSVGDIAQWDKEIFVRFESSWVPSTTAVDSLDRPAQKHPTLGAERRLDHRMVSWRATSTWNVPGIKKAIQARKSTSSSAPLAESQSRGRETVTYPPNLGYMAGDGCSEMGGNAFLGKLETRWSDFSWQCGILCFHLPRERRKPGLMIYSAHGEGHQIVLCLRSR